MPMVPLRNRNTNTVEVTNGADLSLQPKHTSEAEREQILAFGADLEKLAAIVEAVEKQAATETVLPVVPRGP